MDWASQQAKPGRWQHGGEVELFFDDTQIEVEGHKFEGARINYEGNRALGWQTLWYGPWLLDGILDGAGDVSEPAGIAGGASAALARPRQLLLRGQRFERRQIP